MKRIAVYCGSNTGSDEIFMTKAFQLGEALANNNIELVYGGAKVGLMGAVADGALAKEGKVIGVLPHFLAEKELQHKSLSEIILVDTMHERKAKMVHLADGFIALPGGCGTMDELFEVLTWGQLAIHNNPIGLLNVNGYYDSLIDFFNTSIKYGFTKEEYKNLLLVSDNIDCLLQQMNTYTPPKNEKWFEVK